MGVASGRCVEPETARTWTIDALVQQALANNAELHYYEAEVAAAKGQRRQAGLWKNPEVSGEYGTRRITGSEGDLQGEGYTRSLSFTQTFEFPGKGSLRKAIANRNTELAELGLRQFKSALEGRVRALSVRYAQAVEISALLEEMSERSAALIKLLRERPVAGVQQLLELRAIEGGQTEQVLLAKEWAERRDETRIELNSLAGLPPSQSLRLKVNPASLPPEGRELNALVLTALEGNLQLKMRIVEVEKAVREISAAKLEVAPDFSIGPFISQDKAGDLEENFGGSLSMTLPLWNWNQGNVETAKARKAQADALLLEARRKVEAAISRRYRALERNRKLLSQIPEARVSELRSAYELAERQYRIGAISLALFAEVRREFVTALKTRSDVVLETWENWLDLNILTGGTLRGYSPENPSGKESK